VPARVEMTSYHAGPGGIATGRFLPAAEGSAPVLLALSPEAHALKSRMLACFSSQHAMLRHFPVGAAEALRPAPVHDACRPPHPGPLFYEGFPWGMTGPRFRALAATALEELGIGTAP
jgi:N-acetylglucosamine malate deacetylase 2